jgi:aerobic carbon-monoxide dehydrogenase medium subunit
MQVPAPFEYERATSVEQAVGLLEKLGPDARIIAGGHSLLPMMKLRLAAPEHLIDINDLADLSYIRREGDEIRIGALTRHRELLESELLAEHVPIVADAERVVADPVVRNRGSIGGSLCQADPAEDLSAVCAALHAQLVIRGTAGERVVAMDDFQQGPYETAVGDAEMLTEVRIPVRPGGSSAYAKVERRAGDWAVTSAGAAVWMEGDTISDARVGLAAVGPNTTGIPAISEALRGQSPSDELYAQAGAIAAQSCSPVSDNRGTADYKRHLADELTRRTLRTAVERIQAGRAGDQAGDDATRGGNG